MNDLTKAAKEGKKVNIMKKMDNIYKTDIQMSERFCPLVRGDCRGMRCMFFNEYAAAAKEEDVCRIQGFLYGVELSLKDIARTLEKGASRGS